MSDARGFTLVEVLVATFVMALLATLGIALLSDTMRSRDRLEGLIEEVQSLELARTIIARDLSQLAPRRARDAFGTHAPSQFEGGNDLSGQRLMAFVRNGHDPLDERAVTSRLQYVEYRLEQGRLIRRSRTLVDPYSDTPHLDRVLLSGIEDLDVRFLALAGWGDVWADGGEIGELSAPRAVSLEIEHERFGAFETVFLTPLGY